MSLKVRCNHCMWLMRVDDRFAGGRCRCHHCGAVIDVPADAAEAPRLPRPQKPMAHPPRVQIGDTNRISWWRLVQRQQIIAAGLLLVCSAALGYYGVLAWRSRGGPVVVSRPIVMDKRNIARVPEAALRPNQTPSFVDFPINAATTVWILDGSESMTEYYENITTLIATSISAMAPGDHDAGIYIAASDASKSQRLRPTATSESALRTAQKLMRNYEPSGHADMAIALTEVLEWKPQNIYLVVSDPIDRNKVEEMRQRVFPTDIAVSVVAIGTADYTWMTMTRDLRGDYQFLLKRDLDLRVERLFETSPIAFNRAADVAVAHPAND